MRNLYKILFTFLIIIFLSSCVTNITRTETDTYTITVRDTVRSSEQKNNPGTRDNGVIYPSSRVIKFEHELTQIDSVVERYYPDFIRLGVFESVGLLFSGDANHALGNGLFGIFPDYYKLNNEYRGSSDYIFRGGIYRFGIGEWRLRWFRDAPNWTWGTSAFEIIAPDSRIERTLASVFPLYIRKRFFLSEKIPYQAVTLSFGVGYFPSQYFNMSGSYDIGSLGGLNLRAYLGLALGLNIDSLPMVRASQYTKQSQTMIIPYAGLGISLLDFLNLVPETQKEWKDYEHSSWNVGLAQAAFIYTGADTSVINSKDASKLISGYIIKFLNASIALPVLDYKLYAGTSLFNLVVLGQSQWGVGILPIRFGYWETLLDDELSTEPFVEFNYYPSSFINIGNRLNLKISNMINFSILLGLASGSPQNAWGNDLLNKLGNPKNFTKLYLGLSLGVNDRIFFPQELRYNK